VAHGRRLTVLSAAYSLGQVGPDAVGGAEQILATLDRALVAAGHRSIVVACKGSIASGELIETPGPRPGTPLDGPTREKAQDETRNAISDAVRDRRIDIVHMHGIDFAACLPPAGVPVLATLHLPPAWYPAGALAPARPGTWLHCVSRSQHRACPPGAMLLPPIYNGVPAEPPAGTPLARRRFALMLSRICPEKGQHLALQAARLADIPLLIGGQAFPYPAHTDYFMHQVQPLLDRSRRWIGPVGFARKQCLLAAARCVLIPSLAPETSSLVAMEAAAAGTPVVAFPNGALAEIVEQGRTGFLVKDVDEMAAAIEQTDEVDSAYCRSIAGSRFSRERMVAEYLNLYRRLAA
jgi:glycosyltransferase involved in cell wall biosynthesis